VALTFDMGGRVDPAMQIMRILLLNGVCATIFPTGAMSQTGVGGQVLAFVKAYPQLFEVGNHTMHHCNLAAGGGGSPTTAPCPTSPPSTTFIQRELTDAAAIIAAGAGQQPIPYWRPPYGAVNATVLNAAAGVGYTKTLLWDVDTIDWKEVIDGGPTAEQIATKVATRAVNGSNVLMHLGGWNTANALPSMIYRLRARGMALSTISDLMDGS
jgi:peptidoglycan/xylan/chitin deacetylase (PgdA/CDA1 family)